MNKLANLEEGKDFKSLKKEMDNLSKQLTKLQKVSFATGAKEFFDKYPQVETVTWNQYTPYWNDGDPTYFSVNIDEIELNGNTEYYSKEAEVKIPKKAYDDAYKFLDSFDLEFFERELTEDGEVTLNRDGTFEVSSYSHD